jgi:hypothetical protein
MPNQAQPTIGEALVAVMLGERTRPLLDAVDLDLALATCGPDGAVSRAVLAAALNAILFDNLLRRVPTGAAFVADQHDSGDRIRFDHGALRTIRFSDGDTGELPAGQQALARILGPLGYEVAGKYPLPRLRMTGWAWAHRDLPEDLPQFFVSELHVDQFGEPFGAVARRVFGTSVDPLDKRILAVLDRLRADGRIEFADAARILPALVSAFDRQHVLPSAGDYLLLLAESAEAAWIATEGNAFNHATSRVPDVIAEAERQRGLGRPIKERVEISRTGRVRQTAFKADPVVRPFPDGDGVTELSVPGSFFEIISRDVDPETGRLDLSFDSRNATGIFAMTRVS